MMLWKWQNRQKFEVLRREARLVRRRHEQTYLHASFSKSDRHDGRGVVSERAVTTWARTAGNHFLVGGSDFRESWFPHSALFPETL